MNEELLIGLTSILVFGIGAQWVAWRFKLPAILLLLISGLLAGPVFHLLDPDKLMGDLLTPFISVSVAIILFEGGLSLRFSELKEVGSVIGTLVSIGVLITWSITAVSANYLFGFGWELSILLGAILVVTGPTVILPLLRQVRPSGQVGPILKWEGIVIDPIGAMLAVLVFEVLLSSGATTATSLAVTGIIKTISFGTITGLAGAIAIYFLLTRHVLPDFLHNPVSLMIIVLVFTVSNFLQHESGLWATTLMGIALANQRAADIHHIVEFKENLRTLLLSALFVLLAARVQLDSLLNNLNWQIVVFLLILIFVARPLSVYASTLFSNVNWREKLFLSWMAPRGVVAASISSIFAITLVQNGFDQAGQLIPIVLITIISTVTIYGLPASWVAKKLGVAKPIPNGVLILGAQGWVLHIASVIKKAGFKVLVADSNWKNIVLARSKNLDTYHGNILSEYVADEINLDGIGRMLSLTQNDEVNSLSTLRFTGIFERSHVFQLPLHSQNNPVKAEGSDHLSGRILFHNELTYDKIARIVQSEDDLHITELSEDYTFDDLMKNKTRAQLPLFQITANEKIYPFTVDNPPSPDAGDKIIYLSVLKEEYPEFVNDSESVKAINEA